MHYVIYVLYTVLYANIRRFFFSFSRPVDVSFFRYGRYVDTFQKFNQRNNRGAKKNNGTGSARSAPR